MDDHDRLESVITIAWNAQAEGVWRDVHVIDVHAIITYLKSIQPHHQRARA
jgi:hypothetical protein